MATFTKEQMRAIEAQGKTIVSASAENHKITSRNAGKGFADKGCGGAAGVFH